MWLSRTRLKGSHASAGTVLASSRFEVCSMKRRRPGTRTLLLLAVAKQPCWHCHKHAVTATATIANQCMAAAGADPRHL